MHSVFCFTFILLVYVTCGVRAGVLPNYEAELINEIKGKVDDLWNVYGSESLYLNQGDHIIYATCNLQPDPNLDATEPKLTGQVLFKQSYPQGKLEVHFSIKGFPLTPGQSPRAIHIHKYGDLSDGCKSAGGHYNPYSVNHPHHPGDFGNFDIQNGEIHKTLSNIEADLFGPYSIIGRSVVVHKLADDLGTGNNEGSLEHGNAGPRVACCVIGITNKANYDKGIPAPQKK